MTRKLSLVTLMLAGACADTAGPALSDLEIAAQRTEVFEGESIELDVRSAGSRVDARRVQWSSSDTRILGVRDGVVAGVAPGSAWAIATAGTARDSVRITVRFANLGAGTALRIGNSDTQLDLGGNALMHAELDGPVDGTTIYAGTVASGVSLGEIQSADTMLFVTFPGAPQVGDHELPAPLVRTDPAFSTGAGPYLRVRTGPSSYRVYVAATTSYLKIRAARLPAEPGHAAGNLVASLSFEAAPLDVRFDNGVATVTPAGTTTVPIFAEFAVPVHHVLRARTTLNIAGGTRAGDYTTATMAQFYGYDAYTTNFGERNAFEGVTVRAGTISIDEPREYLDAALWLPLPEAGKTYEVDAGGPSYDDFGTPWAFARIYSVGPDGNRDFTICVKGSATVTEYRAPGERTYGVVAGTLTCRVLWNGETATHLSWEFRSPVAPKRMLPTG